MRSKLSLSRTSMWLNSVETRLCDRSKTTCSARSTRSVVSPGRGPVLGRLALGRFPLGRLFRLAGSLELLLRRQLAALGDDERLHLDTHVGEDVDRHRVAADALDRVGEVDLAPVDAHLPRPPELVGDVGRGHGAEERAGRPGLDVEAEHRLAEQLGDLLRLLDRPRLVPRALVLALAELGYARGRGGLGEP